MRTTKNTFEVTNCDLKDGGTYGENRTVNGYYSCDSGYQGY